MFSTLLVVLPIFALVFAGWLARRLNVLGANATTELNRYVVYLALPALLFDVIAHARFADIWQPGFIGAFGLSSLAVFALTILLRLRPPHRLADAAIDGLKTGYPNTGYMGFPLALAAFGHEALAPTTIGMIITVCVTFALAIVIIEIGLQTETNCARLVAKVGLSLMRNPLIAAPALGALFPLTGSSVPDPATKFLQLLGGSASPCALVALGLFLAEKRGGEARQFGATTLLVGLKLILQPVLAWGFARYVFGLAPLLSHVAVLLAALPTGTGPFMLAEFYHREAGLTAKVILVSTVLSVVTLTAYLALVR